MSAARTEPTTGCERFLEARARRIARKVEALCRFESPGCRASAVSGRAAGTFDLCLGARGAPPEERVWARDLDPAALDDDASLERLARFLGAWIEPPAAAAKPVAPVPPHAAGWAALCR